MPLAPLSKRNYRYDLERAPLIRMVSALMASYEMLDLGNLSWAYWHACASTIHIAPAQFGAAIEALQRAYVSTHGAQIKTTVLPRAQWKELLAMIVDVFANVKIHDDSKRDLIANLSGINRAPQRALLGAVLRAINIELGTEEDDAWKRRNEAAHGLPIPEGEELAAIRDTKLLRGLFHRMLLRISNASDAYVDYVSLNNPYRLLNQTVSEDKNPNRPDAAGV